MATLPDFQSLPFEQIAEIAAAHVPSPVDQWQPERCGDSNIRIAADGTWHHDGRPIARPELVRLFARLLRREPDGRYALVTPHEKLDIAVEDAPLVVTEMTSRLEGVGRKIAFRLTSGDILVAGAEHPLRVDDTDSGPCPALVVRNGIEARVGRAVYYELADIALAEGHDPAGVWSDGIFFPLVPA